MLHAEKATNLKVLARLRHHAFIRSDHQSDEIDAVCARKHVLHKLFVAGHVDKTSAHITQIEISKPDVDGDAAPLFFGEPVGVNSRQRAHQGRLAVIDVTRCADNDRFHLNYEKSGYNTRPDGLMPKMFVPITAIAIRLLWVVCEHPYLRRNRIKPAQNWDRHSAKLWDVANAIELAGLFLGFAGIGRMHTALRVIGLIGLALLISGIGIRSIAIHTLGKFFTGTVVIKTDHQLIRAGLYKHLRHPAYTGTLLAHLGLGLAFMNWFSLLLSTVPFLLVAMYRMHVEERALSTTFGAEYSSYCETSKRIVPGVY